LGLSGLAEDFAVELENQWFQNFPALESFTLFIDPYNSRGTGTYASADGKILLYEPEDVPVYCLGNRTASHIRQVIMKKFDNLAPKDRGAPLIEVFVTSVRKPKKVPRVKG
jgi:hypothetical protein